MKLTWFGATALRVHVGGQIFVFDPGAAEPGIKAVELLSGSEQVIEMTQSNLPRLISEGWLPRRAVRLIEEPEGTGVEVLKVGARSRLIEAPAETRLLLVSCPDEAAFGRWAEGGTVGLFGTGSDVAAAGEALLRGARPSLILLGVVDDVVGEVVERLREHLDGAGLVALEPRLAVEV